MNIHVHRNVMRQSNLNFAIADLRGAVHNNSYPYLHYHVRYFYLCSHFTYIYFLVLKETAKPTAK